MFQVHCSVVSNSLQPYGLQRAMLPCPSWTPRAYSNSRRSSWWCHPTISSSVVPFSSWLQSFPASGSFPMSPFFPSGGQNVGTSASASALPINIQGWFSLGLTGLILSSTPCYFSWRCTWSLVISMAQNEIYKLCQAGGHRAIGCSLLYYSGWVESTSHFLFLKKVYFCIGV